MFTYTYLYPEGMWAVYEGKRIVAMFLTEEEAAQYCQRHNNK